jgi:hypothetical protein
MIIPRKNHCDDPEPCSKAHGIAGNVKPYGQINQLLFNGLVKVYGLDKKMYTNLRRSTIISKLEEPP